MKRHRFTAMLTALALLLTGVAHSAAAAEESGEDSEYIEAQYILTALGVNHFSEPESIVTYNTFKGAITAALDIGNSFYDFMQLTGVSYSAETGMRAISFDDAVRSLVNITGYRISVPEADGGIGGYITVAASKGILKNVDAKAGQDLAARDAAVMLCNALGTEMLQSVYNGNDTEYKTIDDETLLYKYRNMRRGRGVVEANQYASAGGNAVGENEVRIDGEYYLDPDGTAAELFGYAVEFWYTEDGGNDEMTVNVIWKDSRRNSEIVIDRDNFTQNEGRKIFYEERGRVKSKTIPAAALILYNGKTIYEYDNTVFDFSRKEAVLLDNNNDGDIDAAIIREGVDRYVSKIDTENGIIYDGLSKEEIHTDEDYDRVRIFDEDKKETSFFSILESEVITVYTSADGGLMDIYISRKQMTGKVEGKTESGTGEYYTVSGERYYLCAAFEKHMKSEIVIGAAYDFYLSSRNEIVYIKADAGYLSYGYLLRSGLEEGSEDKAWCKILADDGAFYVYNLNEKAKVDGRLYKDAKKYTEALSAPQLIRYEINEEKELTVIDTQIRGDGETEDSLNSFGAKNQMAYNTAFVGFDGKIKMDTDKTLVFFCPGGGQSTDGWGVAKADYLKSSEKYTVQAFSGSAKNCVAEAVVIDGNINDYRRVDKFSKSYVVKDIVWTLNDDDEAVRRYTVFNRTSEYTFFCADAQVGEDEDIHKGDVVNAALNGRGEFCDIVKVYDAQTHKKLQSDVISAFEGTEYTARCLMAAGYIYFNNGTTIGISDTDPAGNTDFVKNELDYFKVNDNLGVIVDSNYGEDDERHIRRVSMSEVKDYLNYRECARVFIRTDQSNSVFIVVYQ